jgi:hypothetical protein
VPGVAGFTLNFRTKIRLFPSLTRSLPFSVISLSILSDTANLNETSFLISKGMLLTASEIILLVSIFFLDFLCIFAIVKVTFTHTRGVYHESGASRSIFRNLARRQRLHPARNNPTMKAKFDAVRKVASSDYSKEQ